MKFDEGLERCSVWLWITLFGGLVITLPASKPEFFDVKFRPLPLNYQFPPIIEVETLTVYPVGRIDSARFESLFTSGDSPFVDDDLQPRAETVAKEKIIERVNDLAEFPRSTDLPAAPASPSNLGVNMQETVSLTEEVQTKKNQTQAETPP
jgi:hypothetical protein